MFDKINFIKNNNQFLYGLLEDFLNTEINEDTFAMLNNFLRLSNFKSGEFEGNQYVLLKENLETVTIIDYVSEEFKSDYSQTRFTMSVADLLELMHLTVRGSV